MVACVQRGGVSVQLSMVQTLVSLHCEFDVQHPPIACVKQVRLVRSQPSCVQALPSSQSALVEHTRQPDVGWPTQRPFWHISPVVHELPSSHAVPLCAMCVHPVAALQASRV